METKLIEDAKNPCYPNVNDGVDEDYVMVLYKEGKEKILMNEKVKLSEYNEYFKQGYELNIYA
ncbi:hypothetical protein BgiBS90_019401, partial [Biomphalaria glabrata]